MNNSPKEDSTFPVKINMVFMAMGLAILLNIFLFSDSIYAEVEILDEKIEDKAAVGSNAIVPLKVNQAPQQTSVADRVIGSTFKTLAKAFLATADIEKLKKENIDKLSRKAEEKFRKQYLKVYAVAEKCPVITERYGLTRELTKEEAIEKIKNIKKKDLYSALNDIPDKVIADQFRQYFSERKQAVEESNIAVQINQLWSKMMDSVSGKKKNK